MLFRWNLMLQPLFGLRRQQPKARRVKPSVKPRLHLEVLEDRNLLSVSPGNLQGDVPVTQPPSAAQAAVNSVLFSEASHEIQVIYTVEQDVLSEVKTLDQELFQTVAALKQQWMNLLGISFTASNRAPNNVVMPPVNNVSGSGSGSGSGATTTHHNPDHSTHSFAALPGSGAGNGSSPDSSSGSATAYGNVFLDNNGNGIIDHGEQGYVGDGVTLYTSTGDVVATTTTDGAGNYSITIPMGQGQSGYYYIAVAIPQNDFATIPGYSQINAEGDSQVFELSMGSNQQINAGLRSMTVTTLQDDAPAAIPMQITLRDAMETGNNGLPAPAVTFVSGLSGTISLQAELDPINASYNILGPTANPITVNGNDDTGTVFTVNATSEIDNLVIDGGNGSDGGGIDNNGTLTLNAVTVTGCDAADGGGIYDNGTLTMIGCTGTNCVAGSSGGGTSPDEILAGGAAAGSGALLYIQPGKSDNIEGGNFSGNKAAQSGGGVMNFGTLTLTGNTVIKNNTVPNYGGGVYNGEGGVINIYGNAQITNNTASWGGGICNYKGVVNLKSAIVANNKAVPQGSFGGVGGGLYDAGGGQVKISGASEFNSNRAPNGAGIYVLGAGSAVRIQTGTTIDYNIATGNGGGVFNSQAVFSMTGGTIYENGGSGGGGLFVFEGTLSLGHDWLFSNYATMANGGGILENDGKVTLYAAGTVQGNQANNGQGGGLYVIAGQLVLKGGEDIGGGNTAKTGGGMYLAGGNTFFSGVTVSGNKATTQAPGVAYTNVANWTANPPGLTDNDDPNGKPVLV